MSSPPCSQPRPREGQYGLPWQRTRLGYKCAILNPNMYSGLNRLNPLIRPGIFIKYLPKMAESAGPSTEFWQPSASRHFGRRPAPAGQVVRLLALGQDERLFHRLCEILLDRLSLDAAAQEIGPEKFAERRRLLGKAAGTPELPGEAAERIVEKIAHRFRDGAEGAALPLLVVRMHPGAMIEKYPKCLGRERLEIRHHGDQHILDAFVEQRAREVVMIDDIGTFLRPEEDRDHVLSQKLAPLLSLVRAPAL